MGVLLQGWDGATWWSGSGAKCGGGGTWRKGLCLEQSLDWIRLELLLLMMMLMSVLMMLMMGVMLMLVLMLLMLLVLMEKVVIVVMLQRHPVVTQPVLRGLGHGLEHCHRTPRSPLSLHELLDGWAVLRLALLQPPHHISAIFSSSRSLILSVRTPNRGDVPSLAGVHRALVCQCPGDGWAASSSR